MKTSVLLTTDQLGRMNAAVLKEGYGVRGGSRWVCEALDDLLTDDPSMRLVGQGEDLLKFDASRSLKLTAKAQEVLDRAVRIVRGQDALQEGVRSAVIRAAIRNRLSKVEAVPKNGRSAGERDSRNQA